MSERQRRAIRAGLVLLTIAVLALGGLIPVVDPVGTAAACTVPATGGTSNTTFTDDTGTSYRIEAFETVGDDALAVCADVTVDVLVVAGGGGSNAEHSGGGGAGGVVFNESIDLSPGNYTISVGAGGAAVPNGRPAPGGNNGENSSALDFVAIGGGSSGAYDDENNAEDTGKAGGSGGGAGGGDAEAEFGAALQPSSESGGFGHPGGEGLDDPHYLGGGGGGAQTAGADATSDAGGDGGAGRDFSATFGTAYGEMGVFAGGGGGAGNEFYYTNARYGVGGLGGGGNASGQKILGDDSSWVHAEDGMPNTGGGGGGVARHSERDENNVGLTTAENSASGGSGVVLIRYVLPVAVAAADTTAVVSGGQVNFTGSASVHPDAANLTYTWAFGDGTGADEPDPSHTYVHSGAPGGNTNVVASLTVSDGVMSDTDQTRQITVYGDLDGDGRADDDAARDVPTDADDDDDGIADSDDPAPYNVFPTAADDASSSTDEDSTLAVGAGDAAAITTLATDGHTDYDDAVDDIVIEKIAGEPFTADDPVTLSSGATVTVAADGSWTYAPSGAFEGLAAGESTTDVFNYTVTDTEHQGTAAAEATANITVTVTGVDDPPTALSLDDTTVAESAGTDATVGNFSATDVDTDVANLTVALVAGAGDADNDNFRVDGRRLIVPDADALDPGTYSIRAQATDPAGGATAATFTVTVTGAPQLDANRSSTTFRPSSGAAIVAPQLTIADPTGSTIDGARVSITANLSATDVLGYNDSACSGLACTYDSTTGILAISGDADASTYQAVLRSVTYTDTDPGADEPPRTIAFSLGAAGNYFPGTGHYYEVVTPGTAVTWEAANTSASTRDYFGLQGYLVTITAQAESTYITDKLDGVSGWLGASDEDQEGVWKWMGGPEAGQRFWEGAAAGSTVGGRFANWNDGEPNDVSGEDYAQFLADGRWNDLPASSALDSYVVEYGGSTGDPTLQLSDEVTVSHLQRAPRFGASPSVATAFADRTTGTVHAVENRTNVTFTAPGVTDPEGDAVTISWDFDDNSTATGATVTHTYGDVISTYAGSRTYTPTVTISDGRKTNTSATLPTVTVHGDLDGDGLADADGLTEVLTDSDDDGDGIADVDDPAPAVATLGTLRGTVTTAAGRPPTGGSITAVSPTFAYRNTTSLAADGTYTLDLPVGSYTVTVTPTDGAPVRAEATIEAEETTILDHTVDPSGTLLVTVTDPAGTPQSGVGVTAARAATAKHATTNDTGVARLTPAAGRYMVAVFADGAGAAAEPVTVTADTTTELTLETSPQTVLHAAVRITEGPGSTTLGGDAIVPVASVTDGLLQVQLVDDGEAGRDTATVGSPADLGRFGVDASTRFAVDVTVTNYTPSSLLWAIRDPTMSVTANGTTPGATDITVTGSPVTMAVTTAGGQQTGPFVGVDPATVAWPSGADDHAETLYNHTISVALYDLSLMAAERLDALDGLTVTTNAQRVGLPAVTDERKRIWVGGPGFRPDGSAHTGFYQVTLPPAQLSAWGVTDADQQLLLEQAGTTRSTTLERIGADTRLTTTDISYSASFVELRPSVPAPPATDTDSGGDDDGGDAPVVEPTPAPAVPTPAPPAEVPAPEPAAPAPSAPAAGGGGGGGAGAAIAQVVTAPIVWFGELEPAEQAVVATGGAGAAGGAAYAFGGDRVQTPINMAQRYARRRLTIRLRGSMRSRLLGMIRNRGRGFSWRRLLKRLRGLRRFFTRTYWRRRREESRQLLTRAGLAAAVRARVREVRTRRWRMWLRGQLRGLVEQVVGGGPIGMGIAVVGGPISALISLVTSEARRWVEDVVMDRIDAVRQRSAAVIVRSNSRLRRLWRRIDPPDAADVRDLAALSVLDAAERHALEAVDITDVGQLAEADAERLATALEVDPGRTEAWIQAAREHLT